jgi:hypothetical protein
MIAIGLTTFQLPSFQDTPPITTNDLLEVVGFSHMIMVDLSHAIGHGHGKIFTAILSQLNILSVFLFSLFYSFVHFFNLWCVSQ